MDEKTILFLLFSSIAFGCGYIVGRIRGWRKGFDTARQIIREGR